MGKCQVFGENNKLFVVKKLRDVHYRGRVFIAVFSFTIMFIIRIFFSYGVLGHVG